MTRADLAAGTGCRQIDAHITTCEARTGHQLAGSRFSLGDGDDQLRTESQSIDSGSSVLAADGGAGDGRWRSRSRDSGPR
jgi:hypothetical protein